MMPPAPRRITRATCRRRITATTSSVVLLTEAVFALALASMVLGERLSLAGFAGTFLGGLLVARYGIMKPLFLGAVLMIVTNLLFAWLAVLGADLGFLIVTISADNLAGGLGGTVFIAYLSSLTNRAYSATQYALFSSLFTLPGKFVGGWSGVVVDSAGYVNFFIYAGLLGIPAVLLVLLIARYGRRLLPNPGGA